MIITPTGGLIYHLRALRYRGKLWNEFRCDLRLWLSSWKPKERSLLLIGPSGGHCLDTAFLRRFDSITAIDPDPLARWFFFRNHKIRPHWSRHNYFTPYQDRFEVESFKRLLQAYPDHCVLFCNFLGQMPLLYPGDNPETAFASWCAAIPELLNSRSWASFHDRISGPLSPLLDLEARSCDSMLQSNEEILKRFYTAKDGVSVELTDHLTGSLFPKNSRRYSRWEIRPELWHLIEMVSHS